MTVAAPVQVSPLYAYLESIGGKDTHEFDSVDQARTFAEGIRDQINGTGEEIAVEQRNSRVIVSLL